MRVRLRRSCGAVSKRAPVIQADQWRGLLAVAAAGGLPAAFVSLLPFSLAVPATAAVDVAIGALFPRIQAARFAGALLVVPLLTGGILAPSNWLLGLAALPLALLIALALVRLGQSLRLNQARCQREGTTDT